MTSRSLPLPVTSSTAPTALSASALSPCRSRKAASRSLWFPLLVSFGFLATLLYALWNMLDESEFFPDGIPDASQQMLLLLLWCLPVSAIVLAAVWFRRGSHKTSSGSAR